MNKYYSGEQLGNYCQKKGKGKLSIFFGNVERVIPIYGSSHHQQYSTSSINNHKIYRVTTIRSIIRQLPTIIT